MANNHGQNARLGAIGESYVQMRLMQQGWDAFNIQQLQIGGHYMSKTRRCKDSEATYCIDSGKNDKGKIIPFGIYNRPMFRHGFS